LVLGFFSFFQSRNLLSSSKVNDINYYFSKVAESLNEIVDSGEKTLDIIISEPQMSDIFDIAETYDEKDRVLNTVKTVFEPYVYDTKISKPYIRDITFFSSGNCPTYHSIVRDISEFEAYGIEWRPVKDAYQWHFKNNKIMLLRSLVDYSGIPNEEPYHVGYLCMYINPTTLLNNAAMPRIFNYNIALISSDNECVYSHTKNDVVSEKLMLKAAYSKDEIVALVETTDKPFVYTYGLAYRNPTTHRKPISKDEAISFVKTKGMIDITEEAEVIHIEEFSENDMW
jgi:hypothetical protein